MSPDLSSESSLFNRFVGKLESSADTVGNIMQGDHPLTLPNSIELEGADDRPRPVNLRHLAPTQLHAIALHEDSEPMPSSDRLASAIPMSLTMDTLEENGPTVELSDADMASTTKVPMSHPTVPKSSIQITSAPEIRSSNVEKRMPRMAPLARLRDLIKRSKRLPAESSTPNVTTTDTLLKTTSSAYGVKTVSDLDKKLKEREKRVQDLLSDDSNNSTLSSSI